MASGLQSRPRRAVLLGENFSAAPKFVTRVRRQTLTARWMIWSSLRRRNPQLRAMAQTIITSEAPEYMRPLDPKPSKQLKSGN